MKKQNLVALFLSFAAASSLSAKEPVAEAKAVIEPAAKTLLEESITALGGREAMSKIKTRQVTGELLMPAQGMKMSLSVTQKAPLKTYSKMVIPDVMTMEQGFDGEIAWSKDTIQGFRKLEGAEFNQAVESAAMFPELYIMDNLISAKLTEEVEENGKKLQVVEVTAKDLPPRTLYFDKTTKLLSKVISNFASGPGGSIEMTIYMSDYKEKDGVKYAATTNMEFTGQKIQMIYKDVKHNIEVEDAIFSMKK